VFMYTVHVPGTLTANLTSVFTIPLDCTLVEVSATGSNANDGKISVGIKTSPTRDLNSQAIGDSNVPVVFGRSNFPSSQYPRFSKGEIVSMLLDFDGAAGTATQNFTAVLTFLPG